LIYTYRIVVIVAAVPFLGWLWLRNPVVVASAGSVGVAVVAGYVITGEWLVLVAIAFRAVVLCLATAVPQALLPAVRVLAAKWPQWLTLTVNNQYMSSEKLRAALPIGLVVVVLVAAAWISGLLIGCDEGLASPFGECACKTWSAMKRTITQFVGMAAYK
jgi:hypothetical protein